MFKHVLIATDGSELADQAAAHGFELAKVLNAKALNANARMDSHHKHYRHHRHHKHIGLLKTHAKPHVAIKHVTPVAKRG